MSEHEGRNVFEGALSDYTGTRFPYSSNVSKQQPYSDLDISLEIHPVRKDITPLRDIDAVRQSVKNLVLTNFFEKPFHPNVGGNVTAKLFENSDRFTAVAIRDEIKSVIDQFEPRVNQVVVEVYDDSERNAFNVNIIFNVIFLQRETEISFNLQRLR